MSDQMEIDAGSDGPDQDSTAWREVLERLDALGEAVGRWAQAAVTDPDNRRRAGELKDELDAIIGKAGAFVDGATDSDAGRTVRDAAEKAGEAIKTFGERVSDEVAPRMVSALETASEKLSEAADRMESKEGPSTDEVDDADSDEASESPAPL